MDKKIEDWNKANFPWRIIDTRTQGMPNFDKEVVITKKRDVFYKFCMLAVILILISFLSLFAIRTYYHDLYRDMVDVSHVCAPFNNITCEAVQCSDVNVNCECIEEDELEDILKDVCPDTINVNINSYLNSS